MATRDNTLKYFMWGYQPHFRSAATILARNLFQALDPRFEPKVTLLGFLQDASQLRHPVCIEPEDAITALTQFQSVRDRAEDLRQKDPRSSLFHSLPQAQTSSDSRLARRSLAAATREAICALPESAGMTSYCSYPVSINGYDVLVVLQIQSDVFDSHYHLVTEFADWDKQRVARSYLDATALVCLDIYQEELTRPDPGAGLLSFHRSSRNALSDAAELLILRVARASEEYGSSDLFEAFNAVSAEFYEKKAGAGKLILARRDHPNIAMDVQLAQPVPLRRHRAVRRLIEVSSRGTSLLSDGGVIYGLGEVRGRYESSNEDLFEVTFSEHYTWSVSHGGNVLLRVAHNKPLALLPRLDEIKVAGDLSRIFDGLAEEGARNLVRLIHEATELGHGAQIVISSQAASEARRLSPQATLITPVATTPELIRKLCAVDGAVVLDPQGFCHAFGVILDGRVSSKGDRSRGSRFNSAVRYADGRDDCLIAVISDDATIDLVPDLRPQLSRTIIAAKMAELESIVRDHQEEEGHYNSVMGWLKENEFYLSPEQCDLINMHRHTVEDRRKSELGRLYIVYTDLAPDPDMNASYLVD